MMPIFFPPNSVFHNNELVKKIPHTHPQPHRSQLFSCHFFLLCSSRQPVNQPFDQEPRACSEMRKIPALPCDYATCSVSPVKTAYRYIFLIVFWRNGWKLDMTDAEYAVHRSGLFPLKSTTHNLEFICMQRFPKQEIPSSPLAELCNPLPRTKTSPPFDIMAGFYSQISVIEKAGLTLSVIRLERHAAGGQTA